MLELASAFALLGLGFAAGYATRLGISRKRRAEYWGHNRYFEPPTPMNPRLAEGCAETSVDASRQLRKQPKMSVGRAFLLVADCLCFALALDFALAVLVILLARGLP